MGCTSSKHSNPSVQPSGDKVAAVEVTNTTTPAVALESSPPPNNVNNKVEQPPDQAQDENKLQDVAQPKPDALADLEFGVHQIAEYVKANFTHKYSTTAQQEGVSFVRRGTTAAFLVKVSSKDVTSLALADIQLSINNLVNNETILVDQSTADWGLSLDAVDDSQVVVKLAIPTTAPFGKFRISLVVAKVDAAVECPSDVVVLYNAWNDQDIVYLENEDERKEYVLADHGLVYTGHQNKITSRGWLFGQFEPYVIEALMIVLKDMPNEILADAIRLSRAMSAKVNVQDDNGILVGNWSGEYEDGTAPYLWTGSTDILNKFVTGGGSPIMFGQCWVFSGVLTTCMRAMGIPCRSVTNFASGHDTQCNKTIDRYFDDEGKIDNNRTSDSVWNFHVWNEVWMDRKDLEPGRGGWQAIDATPQERSDGIFQTGPQSLVCIKEGEDSSYDHKFLFAEVNADIRYWAPDPSQPSGYRLVRTEPKSVGKHVSTKMVGSDKRLDVTDLYKYPEGSAAERAAVLHDLDPLVHDPTRKQVDVDFSVHELDCGKVGSDVELVLKVNNSSDENLLVEYSIGSFAMDYTGSHRSQVKSITGKDNAPFEAKLTLSAEDYQKFLNTSEVVFEGICHAVVSSVENQPIVFADSKTFALDLPHLDLQVPEESRVLEAGKATEITVNFKNPLSVDLHNCVFTSSGVGLTEDVGDAGPTALVKVDTIPANGEKNVAISVKPRPLTEGPGAGEAARLVVMFESDEIKGMHGDVVVSLK